MKDFEYERINFQDDVSEYPNRIRLINNGDGTYSIFPEKGEIFQLGTPHDSVTMNHLDEGIYNANRQAKANKENITSLAIEVAILKDAALNNFTHNIFVVNFATLDSVNLEHGVWDMQGKRVVI